MNNTKKEQNRLSTSIKAESEDKSDLIKREEELAYAINATGGKEVAPELKHIIHLYAKGDIDYKTACLEINKYFSD